MVPEIRVTRRVVFDTGVVLSALVFATGRLAWLRHHWSDGAACTPLISRATAAELARVLAYPKFRLLPEERHDLLAEYLPFCESVTAIKACPALCRDPKDQPFLDLAHSGRAEFLVTGDHDLLDLSQQKRFSILSAEDYWKITHTGF